jgi:hypothetical protein
MSAATRTILLAAVMSVLAGHESSSIELKDSPIQRQHLRHLADYAYFAGDLDDEFWQESLQEERSAADTLRKSAFKAGIYSALLPGWGQFYLENKGKARVFFTVEALSWVGFIAFRTYGAWKKDDLIRFAGERAGADLRGKDDHFLDMVGFYDDIDDYNAFGRAIAPEREYLRDTPSNHWRWQSKADRLAYRDLKNRSREAYRRSQFMIGLAILNRIVSVIDAVRDAKRAQHQVDKLEFGDNRGLSYQIKVNPFSLRKQISFTLFTPF